MKKKLTIALAFVLVIVIAVAGTVAYLTDVTDEITNTFTVGNIKIDLAETTTDFKMIPGQTIAKNPTVTVKAGSEACWLFVEVEESSNLDDFISYSIASGWTALDGYEGVYYRAVSAVTSDTGFSVLANDQVTVKSSVTSAMMDGIAVSTTPPPVQPSLTFTAYAIQSAGFSNAAAAWAELNPAPVNP